MRGRVTKDGENYAECELWAEKQGGMLVVEGWGKVTLPSED